jgi:MFS family permease
VKQNFNFFGINKVIKCLIFSDLVLLFGWGLISPILAIFIVQKIKDGDVKVAGTAIGLYWLVKSLIQIPIAHYLDKRRGEKDDYYAMILGIFIASLVPLGYIFASLSWHIYFLQLIYAFGMALNIPAWGGIFVRHVDKGKEALSWGLESSAIGIGAGIAGILGGTIAKFFGFIPLFILVFVFGIVSIILLLLIFKDLIPKDKIFPIPKP